MMECESEMSDSTKLLTKFRISDEDLSVDENLSRAFQNYIARCAEFCDAKNELKETIAELREALSEPLRSSGLVPEDGEWTFKEDDSRRALVVYVWSQPRYKGRRKKELPFERLTRRKNV